MEGTPTEAEHDGSHKIAEDENDLYWVSEDVAGSLSIHGIVKLVEHSNKMMFHVIIQIYSLQLTKRIAWRAPKKMLGYIKL